MDHITLRKIFANYWKKKRHIEVPPISLVPENDPTTLFTGSGMQQLVPYLLGQPHPLGKRLYNIQRSFRAQDIEEVGDNRHTTFFEMMGNWSLGDYFKKEQLSWFWDFLTKKLHLPKEKLYVTVYRGNKEVPKDIESIEIWKKIGVSDDHIFTYPAEKNWWSRAGTPKQMPAGEIGGPDSEVFYEFTHIDHEKKYGPSCHPNCDCGRFLEIGNSVFIQYKKGENGKLYELPQKNVDFGGGLERILAAIRNDPDIFNTDVFLPIIKKTAEMAHISYQENYVAPLRVIADHLRAAVMLAADGVTASNKDQGYILRRLIRRSVRFGRKINLPHGFISSISEKVIELFAPVYPHVLKQKASILQMLSSEEDKFSIALEKGLKQFQKLTDKKQIITSEDAFYLYETYGFPVEMTQEIAKENNIAYDISQFRKLQEQHKAKSKKGVNTRFRGGLADRSIQTVKLHTATHLLHQALRTILGTHVQQKGSNITSKRLRFDFSHPSKLTKEEIKKVEILVNKKIKQDLPVYKQEIAYKEAVKQNALAFFKTKYPEKVTVYSIGSFSKEICGGPHVKHTGVLGKFVIKKEQSAGTGIRRIYAILT